MSATPRRIRRGTWNGTVGVFYAWPVDGYWDIHHAPLNGQPDGSDVISEFHGTFADAREWVRQVVEFNLVLSGRP